MMKTGCVETHRRLLAHIPCFLKCALSAKAVNAILTNWVSRHANGLVFVLVFVLDELPRSFHSTNRAVLNKIA
jgi:hypothetical protein